MSITRLSGGLTPADGSDPRTFPGIFNDVADLVEAAGSDIDDLEAKNIPAFGTATPSDGQVLTFDSAGSVFVPEDVAATLEDLTDTSISSPATGEVLGYDGTNWVNAAAAVGGILQVVSTTKTNTFSTSSGSLVDITGLSASITPLSATSKILVTSNIMTGNDGPGTTSQATNIFQLVRDATPICIGPGPSPGSVAVDLEDNIDISIANLAFLDSPSTTGAITYKIQMRRASSTTAYVNRRAINDAFGGTSTITLMEVAV